MFGKLGHLMYRRRWYVLAAWLLILVVAFTQAQKVGSVLGPGDFVLKGSDSAKAAAVLNTTFHQNNENVTLVVARSPNLTIHDAAFRASIAGLVARIRADRALRIQFLDNPLVTQNQQLISRDGHAVAVLVSSNLKEQDIEPLVDPLRNRVKMQGFQTFVTGTPALNHDYAVQSQKDLQKGNGITGPILIIILLLVFGTLVAAGLPFILALFSITVSLALVYWFAHYITASIYVENVVEVLGLGISIDYSLFIVYRFREELAHFNGDAERAVVRTMETTGRAVFFSGCTVAIGLASLILTGLSFMQSMGLGGMLVPVCALAVAMTLLPAVLGMLGTNVNRFAVTAPFRALRARIWPSRAQTVRAEGGAWHRLATAIMRRPVLWGGSVLVLTLAMAFPVTGMKLAYGGLKNAPQSVESVAGFTYMRSHFTATPDPAEVVLEHRGPGTFLSPAEVAAVRRLEQTLRRDPEATHVVGPAEFIPTSGTASAAQMRQLVGRYLSPDLKIARIQVVPRNEVGTSANEAMTRRIRDQVGPLTADGLSHDTILVGGAAADYIDFNDAMYAKFPLIVVLVLMLTLAFLFFAFRSVFLPVKAILLNLLSVGAAYGVLDLVFQHGAAHQLLRLTPEDGIAPWVPIFLFAFLFGLSMDYEVFLISRIREHWLRTGNNRASVAFGLEKTGRLISSAAAIMVVAFAGFQVQHEIQLREFGFGLMASIALDATLIRVILVPAIMELMGTWNWWVPQRLQSWSRRGSSFEEDTAAGESLEPATAF